MGPQYIWGEGYLSSSSVPCQPTAVSELENSLNSKVQKTHQNWRLQGTEGRLSVSFRGLGRWQTSEFLGWFEDGKVWQDGGLCLVWYSSNIMVTQIPPLELGKFAIASLHQWPRPQECSCLELLHVFPACNCTLVNLGSIPQSLEWHKTLKRSTCSAWRVVLELTLVANINYGPFRSSTRARLEQFLLTKTVNHPLWQNFNCLKENYTPVN